MQRVSKIEFFRAGAKQFENAKTGVSLHGHTLRSREWLTTLPLHFSRIPILRSWIKRNQACYESESGEKLDFSRLFWSPPISGPGAYDLEAGQIEVTLGLESLVSITDHDDIEAPKELQRWKDCGIPISLEWTVPFDRACFHLGVHNLPPKRADELFQEMNRVTRQPKGADLEEVLSSVSGFPETLVVLNHPYWNQMDMSDQDHAEHLRNFWLRVGSSIHAIEFNATRNWRENRKVVELAEAWEVPLVSGGDRHGFEPAGSLNLTNSRDFGSFVREIREDGLSRILIMPQYLRPKCIRHVETLFESLRFYPHLPEGRKAWYDRVHYLKNGIPVPLSNWIDQDNYLGPVRFFTALIQFLDGPIGAKVLGSILTARDRWHDVGDFAGRLTPDFFSIGGLSESQATEEAA